MLFQDSAGNQGNKEERESLSGPEKIRSRAYMEHYYIDSYVTDA